MFGDDEHRVLLWKWIHACNDGFDKLGERIIWTFERMDFDMYGAGQCDTCEKKASVKGNKSFLDLLSNVVIPCFIVQL